MRETLTWCLVFLWTLVLFSSVLMKKYTQHPFSKCLGEQKRSPSLFPYCFCFCPGGLGGGGEVHLPLVCLWSGVRSQTITDVSCPQGYQCLPRQHLEHTASKRRLMPRAARGHPAQSVPTEQSRLFCSGIPAFSWRVWTNWELDSVCKVPRAAFRSPSPLPNPIPAAWAVDWQGWKGPFTAPPFCQWAITRGLWKSVFQLKGQSRCP